MIIYDRCCTVWWYLDTAYLSIYIMLWNMAIRLNCSTYSPSCSWSNTMTHAHLQCVAKWFVIKDIAQKSLRVFNLPLRSNFRGLKQNLPVFDVISLASSGHTSQLLFRRSSNDHASIGMLLPSNQYQCLQLLTTKYSSPFRWWESIVLLVIIHDQMI